MQKFPHEVLWLELNDEVRLNLPEVFHETSSQ